MQHLANLQLQPACRAGHASSGRNAHFFLPMSVSQSVRRFQISEGKKRKKNQLKQHACLPAQVRESTLVFVAEARASDELTTTKLAGSLPFHESWGMKPGPKPRGASPARRRKRLRTGRHSPRQP